MDDPVPGGGEPEAAAMLTQPSRHVQERLLVAGQAFTGFPLDTISVTDIKVGQRSQLVSAQALPGSAFAATSFGVRVAADPCAPGIIITCAVNYIGPALGAGDTFTVTGVIFGRSAG